MVNSLFTVFSERTVSTTKHYNVTESFLLQLFYPYIYTILILWPRHDVHLNHTDIEALA